MVRITRADRPALLRRGRQLEYFTVLYNSLEGLVGVVAGLLAGSIALVGFGVDSAIEVTSGAALLWRLHQDRDPIRRESRERLTLQIVGVCFLALALYIGSESLLSLVRKEAPARSLAGVGLAVASLVVMPLLAHAKHGVARALESAALTADARQTDFCTYLSAILLGGLLLNAALGWWWADPVSALIMVPIIAREGVMALRAKACCSECRLQ